MKKALSFIAAIILAPFLAVLVIVGLIPTPKADAACVGLKDALSVEADVAGLPSGKVAGYGGVQLKNAALIVNAGKSLKLSLYGQQIGVMTAMGESGLQVLDYGDGPGPDSRGLFQQRGNGAWGSYTDRMDPTISATNFFKAMMQVSGWESLTPTEAAHKTQRNADPDHYTKYWDAALKVVDSVSGTKVDTASNPDKGHCNQGPTTGGHTTGKDDYPWKDNGSWVEVGVAAATNHDTNFYYRECVDFAFWRVLQQTGDADKRPLAYDNNTFVPGRALGNAIGWRDTWLAKGWPVNNTPEVGAVAWFDGNLSGPGTQTGPEGHVAIVLEIKPDGSVVIEEYNGQYTPNDHKYGQRTIAQDEASAFLHIPASAKKAD